jgi:anti-sigma B factor antagonist
VGVVTARQLSGAHTSTGKAASKPSVSNSFVHQKLRDAARALRNWSFSLATENQAAISSDVHLEEKAECGVEIFGLSCEIDRHYAPTLRAMFRGKIEARCKALILDLTDVYYIDSSALATFIEYYRDAGEHGGVLCLCGVNEGLKPIFDAVELATLLPMFDTVVDAVAAVTHSEIQPFGKIALLG